MGTIISKLNWLRIKKDELVDRIKTKFIRANDPSNGLSNNPSLENIDAALDRLWRHRLVPIITMYMPYSYGTLNGVQKYVPLKWYSSSYSWLDDAIDKTRCVYDTNNLWDTIGRAPILNREDKGVIVGTMPTHKYNAVHNQPFVMSVGVADFFNNKPRWDTHPIYAGLSYAYTNRNIKVLMSDDDTRNDGAFILGNIALVDPLMYPEVREDSMVQLVNSHVNPPARSKNVDGYFGNFTFVSSGVNITTITINHGYTEYSYIWPIVVGELYPTSTQAPIAVSIKSIKINANTTQVVVATGSGGDIRRGGFKLLVYGKK